MICQSEPGKDNRCRMNLHHESGLAILRNVVNGDPPGPTPEPTPGCGSGSAGHSHQNRAGRQEAHVFTTYTIMKRFAVKAALGALVVSGLLQSAHAQAAGAAAPKKDYKPGEYEMY